jgi:hypothetical protein
MLAIVGGIVLAVFVIRIAVNGLALLEERFTR